MTTPTNTNPALVLAWQTFRFNEATGGRDCAFYAETSDGAIFTTCYRPYTVEVRDNFVVKGDTWTRVDARPVAAQFIGRYATPNALRVR